MEEETADTALSGLPSIAVEIPPLEGDPDEYPFYEAENSSVQRILAERDANGEQEYKVLTWDGEIQWLSWDLVIGMDFGNEALTEFEQRPKFGHDGSINNDEDYADGGPINLDSSDEEMPDQDDDEEDEEEEEGEEEDIRLRTRRSTRSSTAASLLAQKSRSQSRRLKSSARQATLREMVQKKKKKQAKASSRKVSSDRPMRSTRASAKNAGRLISQTVASYQHAAYDSDTSSEDLIISDLVNTPSQWKKKGRGATQVTYFSNDDDDDDDDDETPKRGRRKRARKRARSESEDSEEEVYEKRRSGRTAHARGSMKERDEDDIEAVEAKKSAPRVIYQQELFREFSPGEEFAQVHTWWCDTCSESASRQKGPLVLCQGCSSAFHKGCIGNRASREHLITKLSDQQFVLQCKRCIRRAHKAEKRPPRLDVCFDCRQVGRSCEPFRKIPATKTDRELTPEVDVPGYQVNNAANVLFRCCKCHRGYHFHHLPHRGTQSTSQESAGIAQTRLNQYNTDWQCMECVGIGERKINDLIAWRPSDETLKESKDTFDSGIHEFDHDEIEYLIRFAGDDYSKAEWYPGAWIYSIAFPAMRYAFEKHSPPPKWSSIDAIPETYFRVDIVFEVKYTSIVPNMTENVEKQRIREIRQVYVKFKGLGYEEAMWVPPPSEEEEEERYADFKRAYLEYCKGNHVRLPRSVTKTLEALRKRDFIDIEVETQPKYISGGTLKDYQMDGMNWLYNRWFEKKNAILADEMGLGKTIQIISFLEVLRQEHKVWPFLVVAPHSTVPNWVREIRTWAPGMRVVPFFGSAESLRLTRKYELFSSTPSSSARDLKCHIVVSSYQAIAEHSTTLKSVPWQVLIVDEGQRLKSDETILYKELWSFKFQHKVLLTGTPLQNNIRELFNLLQFLDPTKINARELEERFGEVNSENLHELHEMIRPFFLRRTKAQALKDLPPISDVIVPLAPTKLQQELYKSICEKDAELIRAIMSKTDGKSVSRSKLNNIVMQLRKVLCHPFVYDQNVEEKLEDQQLVFRNLVDASAKLKFLELMLPRLHEKGHRVLMFSQFLHMLDIMEDFLNGLGLQVLRLDGSNDTAEKQKLIDAYNAPESPYFAFLLSTRAGGVGINLATADTVIILDPDWNPHQDLQAIARAHRIGQKKKVLVFHLMTVKSSEEKMLRMSKKKLGLDHLIIQRMGADGQEEEEDVDVESVLKFGAEEILKGEVEDIVYDLESIDKLLDRDHMKDTIGEQEEINERDAQFSFARVWATEKGERREVVDEPDEEKAPDLDLWSAIIQQRKEDDAREKAAKMAEYGRGQRKTTAMNYALGEEDEEATPVKKAKKKVMSDDDTDFQETDGESDTNSEAEGAIPFHPEELAGPRERGSRSVLMDGGHRIGSPSGSAGPVPEHGNEPSMDTHMEPDSPASHGAPWGPPPMAVMYGPNMHNPAEMQPGADARITPIIQPPAMTSFLRQSAESVNPDLNQYSHYNLPPGFVLPPGYELPAPPPRGIPVVCRLCTNTHMPGECPLRKIPVEYCQLCGLAHFGEGPTCPHLNSLTQIDAMLEAIKGSPDPPHLRAIAKNYLRNRRGALVQQRKLKKAKAERLAAEMEAVKELARKGT
ncbi:hypothetical protein TWF281_007740 [Arthrobotrys megalospora]